MLILFGLIGTSVVQALLKDGTFKPRAVMRNANSDAGRSLAALGADVVEAAFDDKEALKRALFGAECVFLVSPPSLNYITYCRISFFART